MNKLIRVNCTLEITLESGETLTPEYIATELALILHQTDVRTLASHIEINRVEE